MRRALLISLSVLAACSSSSSRSTGPTASDAATYNQKALEAAAAATGYKQAAGAMASPADCTAALQKYEASMQPLLDQMRQMARGMDDFMKSAGQPMAGDLDCGMQLMQDELARHKSVACSSPDMAANLAEVVRHCDAMASFADHMEMRAVEAGQMMSPDGGMAMGAPGPTADAGWMEDWTDGGFKLQDGGAMAFDDAIPGCIYTPGGYMPDGGFAMDGGTH